MSLSSILRPNKLSKWLLNKLGEDEQLSEFHSRYWGVSMEGEERAWLESHTTDVEKHQMSNKKGIDNDQDDKMDIDIDEKENCVIKDYISGCHPLTVSPLRNPDVLWVRAEYIRIFNFIINHIETIKNRRNRMPQAFVITGQPGIGKTVFLSYVLRRCLAEKRPVILNEGVNYFLFVADGVIKLPQGFRSADVFNEPVLSLFDSGYQRVTLPKEPNNLQSRLDAIYTTSPSESRWKTLHQTMGRRLIIMNPWTLWEIEQAAPLLFDKPDFTAIADIYHRLGPTPRLCLEYLADPQSLHDYEMEVNNDIDRMDGTTFYNAYLDSKRLVMSAIGHELFIVRRAVEDNLLAPAVVTPITKHVSNLLSLRAREYLVDEQVRLIRVFSGVQDARVMTGNLFEYYGQKKFRMGISIDYYPMVRLPDKQDAKCLNQWCSPFVEVDDPTLESYRLHAMTEETHLAFTPRNRSIYESDRPPSISPDTFYTPTSPNQVGFDSFIIHSGRLYLFQFTLAKSHKVKDGFISFLKKCHNSPSEDNWIFIFVKPEDDADLMCPVPNIKEFKPFCAILRVE